MVVVPTLATESGVEARVLQEAGEGVEALSGQVLHHRLVHVPPGTTQHQQATQQPKHHTSISPTSEA